MCRSPLHSLPLDRSSFPLVSPAACSHAGPPSSLPSPPHPTLPPPVQARGQYLRVHDSLVASPQYHQAYSLAADLAERAQQTWVAQKAKANLMPLAKPALDTGEPHACVHALVRVGPAQPMHALPDMPRPPVCPPCPRWTLVTPFHRPSHLPLPSRAQCCPVLVRSSLPCPSIDVFPARQQLRACLPACLLLLFF